jgi:hypothetical protein
MRPRSRSLPADLDYTHERLYRAVSCIMEGELPIAYRLANAKVMLASLSAADFPKPLRADFNRIIDAQHDSSAGAAKSAAESLCRLFITLSTQVVNTATLGNEIERLAWVVMQAQEGYPAPFLSFMRKLLRLRRPLPRSMVQLIEKAIRRQMPKRHGRTSLHPAEKIAIAWMVRDRFNFQQLHSPNTSLNAACKDVSSFIGKSWQTAKAAYFTVYHGPSRRRLK